MSAGSPLSSGLEYSPYNRCYSHHFAGPRVISLDKVVPWGLTSVLFRHKD
jgi:hypothetical protein